MQEITAANCPTERIRSYDARDNATYWVRKIPNTKQGGGDLCWMETNLAYAGGGTNTYGDATTPITQGTTSADYIYTAARYFIPPGSNRTTGTTDPSTSTNGTGQYGYLYNWCAALNGQSVACQTSTTTQPNQSANDGTNIYNICPAGWRLPVESGSGEYIALNNAINGGSTTSPSGLLTNGLYMYGGSWANGKFSNQGVYGYYWSSTSNGSNAYSLGFGSAFVVPAGSGGKDGGRSVRCVAE